jgi:outer membrane lipoprotein carrier protein
MKILLSLLSLTLFTTTFANTASDNLVAAFKNTTTIQGQFTQRVYNQRQHLLSSSHGNFKIQRPNKFVWNVTKPMAQLTIADGKQIWLYQPDLLQVTVSPMTQKIGATPLAILSGSTAALTQNFTMKQLGPQKYALTAKQSDSAFSKITLQLAGKTIKKMQLADSFGQKTVINFTDVSINNTLAKKAFTFTPPKGVDVIKN